MKLADKLEKQLARLFVVSAGVGALVLMINTYISTSEIKNKAVGFITSHVQQISYAEINSQNINDIDREVRRLYEAWKGTQDIDLRVDVLLDGKLVAKAGQLQSFGVFSFSEENSYRLPSGQTLFIKVDLDLSKQFGFDLLMLLVFGAFLYGTYAVLQRNLGRTIQSVTTPLENRVAWIGDVSSNLPDSMKRDIPFEPTSIDELQALDFSLAAFVEQIAALEGRIKEAGIKEGRLRMAEQLAHNIKGKIGLLLLSVENTHGLGADEKTKLKSAVHEVAAAAQILLKSGRSEVLAGLTQTSISEVDLMAMLQRIADQKRESAKFMKIHISTDGPPSAAAVVQARSSEIEAAFYNVIDNAIDAIDSRGSIRINLRPEAGNVVVTVSDDGRGIPKDVLPMLMGERVTYGKPDGNGLGLFHAKNTFEALGGSISLSSIEKIGTTATICLPTVGREERAEPSIFISRGQTLVVVDDDSLIHTAVDLLLKTREGIDVVHLLSVEAFEQWIDENGLGELDARVYWFDYDLKNETEDGLSLILKHSLQFESYLVTGTGAEDVVKAAKMSNVRILSKSDIHKINFRTNEPRHVEELNLGSWKPQEDV